MQAPVPEEQNSDSIYSGRAWFMAKPTLSLKCIQGEVELQDVDPRLAQEPELAAFGMLLDETANGVFGKATCLGHASDLIERGGRADMRVEAAARCGNQIDRDGRGVSGIGRP